MHKICLNFWKRPSKIMKKYNKLSTIDLGNAINYLQ